MAATPDTMQTSDPPLRWPQRLAAHARSWGLTLLITWLVWMTVQSLRGQLPLPAEAPDFVAQTLDGKPLQLRALRGHPVVLYFGASWCPACRVTAPTVDRFARSHPEVRVVGIAAEDAADARAYQDAHPRSFPIVAETAAIATAYGVRALPTTVVLDAGGRVTWSRQGVVLPWELDWHLP
jgi:thiol-disulfide isomerase/thioredoxin